MCRRPKDIKVKHIQRRERGRSRRRGEEKEQVEGKKEGKDKDK